VSDLDRFFCVESDTFSGFHRSFEFFPKYMTNHEAMSMAEAAASLGVSVPTVRQMVARGQLVAFRTPGGHLRFTTDSVRAAKGESIPATAGRVLSSSLQNRRERVEELNLEATEFRAQRQLDTLRREQEQEEAERSAEAEALREERRNHTRPWSWIASELNARKRATLAAPSSGGS